MSYNNFRNPIAIDYLVKRKPMSVNPLKRFQYCGTISVYDLPFTVTCFLSGSLYLMNLDSGEVYWCDTVS